MTNLAPHARRVRRWLARRDEPVALLWALPGAGTSALLAALGEDGTGSGGESTAVRLVSDAVLAEPRRWRRALERGRAESVRWYGGRAEPPAAGRIGAELAPGEHLVLATSFARWSETGESGGGAVAVPVEVTLLRESEVRALARILAPEMPDATVRAVARWSGGWLEPAALVLEALAGEPLDPDAGDGAAVAESDWSRLSGVRRFLGSKPVLDLSGEALEALPSPMRRLLERRPEAAAPIPSPGAVKVPPDRGLEARLLGPPEILAPAARGAAGGALAWPYARVAELFARLASRPDLALGRDDLLEALFPESDEAAAVSHLHPAVSHLRKLLRRLPFPGSPVLFRNRVYRLNPEWPWRIDRSRFLERTEAPSERSSEELEAAWSLYRGPFAAGLEAPWIEEERERLARRYEAALLELLDRREAEERLSQVEDLCRTLLLEQPLREDLHVRLMRVHARRGRLDLVRRQYERLCRRLLEELDSGPMDATMREYQRLMG